MSATPEPYCSALPASHAGFAQLLHAEWTKFRSVRGWVLGTMMIALVLVLFAILTGASNPPPSRGHVPVVPIGPDGGPVADSFYFVHQTLVGQGSITASVSSLQAVVSTSGGARGAVPWAKAGLIIKANTTPGSPYAAIMVTSSHGIRLQWDFTGDVPGLPGPVSPTSARWLRLSRRGQVVIGYDSMDGVHWSAVGRVRLACLPQTVQAGVFVASPAYAHGYGTAPSVAAATFGPVSLQGYWPQTSWTGGQVGVDYATFSGYPPSGSGGFMRSAGGFAVTGAGDIAPAVRDGATGVVGDLLSGSFVALIVAIIVGATFITAEYRCGLIGATLAGSPHRGRLLAAEGLVLGWVTFAAGLVGAAVAVPVGERLARFHHVYVFPMSTFTELRVIVATAAMIAAAAVLSLALGILLRRSAAAAAALIAAIVLPYPVVVATTIAGLSVSFGDWLMRVSPAAALAGQQTLTVYHQVAGAYTPLNGYYPLVWWAGLAVLCGYAAAALCLALLVLNRRDA